MPSSGVAGSYDGSVFSFLGPSILLSIGAAPIYTPTNSVDVGSLFYTSPPEFIICRLFDDNCSD